MATEKDKMKAAAVRMYLDEHPLLGEYGPVDWDQIEFAMRFADAARADAIEECAQIAEAFSGDDPEVCAIADAIRRSLSRKQEEPRPSEKETDRFGKW